MSDSKDTLHKAVYGRVGLPLELEDGAPPELYSRLLYALAGTTVALLIWASIGQIREVAHTIGDIKPTGNLMSVEHLEGGIVRELLVREGDWVKAGQPLARLEKEDTTTELARIESRLRYLTLEEERLLAQEYNGDAQIGLRLQSGLNDLSSQQRDALRANRQALSDEQATLAARVAQKEAEILSLERQLTLQESQVALEKEKFDIQAKLLEDGFTSRRRFLDAQSEYQRALLTQQQTSGNLASSREMLAEALASLSHAGAQVNRDVADERSRIAQERNELNQEARKAKDRQNRLFVKAPIDGYIQLVGQSGRGAVVNPGDLIAEIVPDSENLVAEVRVNPKDIGHIEVGHEADITVTSYDTNIQGTITGKVGTISASSFEDENGDYYFKAIINFTGNTIGEGSNTRPVRPGMQVNAQIITGSKSILQYILNPVTRAMRTIFTER
ncbi:HlyD family type I secretion periplasmic adaptor subunit [Roseibium sp. CAU 1637]|uniref:Membrane fusion protein (MFP) family protein n=1 Tax=Roseibium limicola TaxID=2816037 RepID=A0A939ERY6_9HYPH|nr:HlyD family type I secretion periplasmic adaptor subunit [Roseibium limicola]MBO0346831.1 HlyD family type I secretion periplasmic adaptor subunit [Roseibium limicola]